MHVIAAKAVALGEALTPEFREYQHNIVVNSKYLADSLLARGFKLVTGGTDNHLSVLNLTSKGINGKQLQLALDRAGITANRNAIPFDTLSPALTSGLRLGTAAVTTRGFGTAEMALIADWIDRVASDVDNEEAIAQVRDEITELCRRIPLYPGMF